jgi:hypothetical protein
VKAFKQFLVDIRALIGKDSSFYPSVVMTDWGTEFAGAFKDFCLEKEIKMEKSCPYTAWQNGLVEKSNQSIVNMSKCLMRRSGLDPKFWGFAVDTACHIHNRLSTRSNPGDKSPYELVKKKKPNLSHLKVFGCKAEIFVEKSLREKSYSESGDHSRTGIFLGYDHVSKGGYIFYVPELKTARIVCRRDAHFAPLSTTVGETSLAPSENSNLPKLEAKTTRLEELYDDLDKKTPSSTTTTKSKNSGGKSSKKQDNSGGKEKGGIDLDSIVVATGKKSKVDYINDRVSKVSNLLVRDAIDTTFYHSTLKQDRRYGLSNLGYDIDKGFIRLAPNNVEDDEVEIEIRQGGVVDPDPNIVDRTPPTVVRKKKQTPKRTPPSPSMAARKSNRINPREGRLSDGRSSRLARIAESLDCVIDSDDYFYYSEHNEPTRHLEESVFYSLGFGDEPLDRKEALNRNDWKEWEKAEKVELKGLEDRKTFEYVPIDSVPKGKKIIRCKWVYKRKPDRYKARLVVKGFMQSPFDYGETYAPVCKLNTI